MYFFFVFGHFLVGTSESEKASSWLQTSLSVTQATTTRTQAIGSCRGESKDSAQVQDLIQAV